MQSPPQPNLPEYSISALFMCTVFTNESQAAANGQGKAYNPDQPVQAWYDPSVVVDPTNPYATLSYPQSWNGVSNQMNPGPFNWPAQFAAHPNFSPDGNYKGPWAQIPMRALFANEKLTYNDNPFANPPLGQVWITRTDIASPTPVQGSVPSSVTLQSISDQITQLQEEFASAIAAATPALNKYLGKTS